MCVCVWVCVWVCFFRGPELVGGLWFHLPLLNFECSKLTDSEIKRAHFFTVFGPLLVDRVWKEGRTLSAQPRFVPFWEIVVGLADSWPEWQSQVRWKDLMSYPSKSCA